MPDLDDWRAEVRTWLAANCPPLMRRPIASEADFCWGGRRWQFQSDEQRLWLERMARAAGRFRNGPANTAAPRSRAPRPT